MRGRDLLPIAGALSKRGAAQPWARSSVNRSYYAAFSEAADYAAGRGYQRSGGAASHQKAWRFVGDIVDGDLRRRAERIAIRDAGLALKLRRERADYRLNASLPRDEAQNAYREAAGIINAIDRMKA